VSLSDSLIGVVQIDVGGVVAVVHGASCHAMRELPTAAFPLIQSRKNEKEKKRKKKDY